VKYDKVRARAIAAAAIGRTAKKKNHPPDLINIALEKLLEASLELPGFSTLDEMVTRIRAEVNAEIFAQVVARMGPEGRQRMQALLATAGLDGRSMFNRLKRPARRATRSRFKAQAESLDQVEELGDTAGPDRHHRRGPTGRSLPLSGLLGLALDMRMISFMCRSSQCGRRAMVRRGGRARRAGPPGPYRPGRRG
jgi:hypothetical protein